MSEEIENVENNERPNEKDIQQVLRTFCEQEQIINLPDPIDAGKVAEIYAAKNGLSLGYQQEVAKEANAQGGYSDNEVTPDNNLNYGLDSGINPEGFNININALVDLSDGLQPEEKLRILLHIKELQEQKKAEEARAETREQVVQARLKTNNSIFTERDAEFFKINGGGELSKGIYSLGLSDYAQSLIDRPASQASKDFLASLEKENVELKGDTNKEKLLNYTVQRFKELGFDDKILKSGTAEIENISFGSVDRKRTKANEVSSQFVVAHKNNNPDFFNNFAMWQSEVKAHQGMEELFNMNANVAAQPSVAKQSVNNDYIGISSLNEPLSAEAGKTGRKEQEESDKGKVKTDNINKIINAIENSRMSVDEYETLKNNHLPSDLMILALGNNKIRAEIIENPDKYNGSQEQKWANVLLNNKDVASAYNKAIGKQEESLAMELKARQGMEELFSNANENPIYEAANAASNRTGYGAPTGLRPATEEELAALNGSNQSASNVKIPADRSMLTKLDHKIFATKDFNNSLGFRDEFILFMKNDDSYNKQQRALLVSAMEEEGYRLNGNDRQKLLQYARIRFKDFGFEDTVVPDDVSMSDIQFVEAKFNNSEDRSDFAQAMYKVTKGEKVAIPNLPVVLDEEANVAANRTSVREASVGLKEEMDKQEETGLMDEEANVTANKTGLRASSDKLRAEEESNDTAADEPAQEEAASDKSISDEGAPKGLRPATADELKRADSAPEPTAASEEEKKEEERKEGDINQGEGQGEQEEEKEKKEGDINQGKGKGGQDANVTHDGKDKPTESELNLEGGSENEDPWSKNDQKKLTPHDPYNIEGGQDPADVILNNAMAIFQFMSLMAFKATERERQYHYEYAQQAQEWFIGNSTKGTKGKIAEMKEAFEKGDYNKVEHLLKISPAAIRGMSTLLKRNSKLAFSENMSVELHTVRLLKDMEARKEFLIAQELEARRESLKAQGKDPEDKKLQQEIIETDILPNNKELQEINEDIKELREIGLKSLENMRKSAQGNTSIPVSTKTLARLAKYAGETLKDSGGNEFVVDQDTSLVDRVAFKEEKNNRRKQQYLMGGNMKALGQNASNIDEEKNDAVKKAEQKAITNKELRKSQTKANIRDDAKRFKHGIYTDYGRA
jgi:hypothetical protein